MLKKNQENKNKTKKELKRIRNKKRIYKGHFNK